MLHIAGNVPAISWLDLKLFLTDPEYQSSGDDVSSLFIQMLVSGDNTSLFQAEFAQNRPFSMG